MKSIKNKIIVFAVIATLIPSLGLGLLSFRLNEVLTNDNVTRGLRTLASFTNRELGLWVNEHIHTTRALSTSNIVIDGLSATNQSKTNTPEKTKLALAHYLRLVHEKLNTMLELTVVDTDGQIIASSAEIPTTTPLPPIENWSHDALIKGIVSSAPHWSTQYATAVLSIAIPVISNDGFIIGALVAKLDLRTLQPSLKTITKLPLGDVLLLDTNGKVLLASHIELEQSMSLSLDPLLLQQLQEIPEEPSVFNSILGRKVIGLIYTAQTFPVIILAERDHREVYAAWVKLRNQFLALVSILILIVTIIALRMGHSIVAPLQRLVIATSRIVNGDYDVRLTAKENDELGQFIQMFNQMTEKLHQNQVEIDTKNQVMQQKNAQLELLSVTDNLTGLYNRSKLNMILEDQLARFQRNHRPFAVLMIDVDHFKTLNDSLGHIVGDEILVAVSKILAQSIRAVDYAIRYGGDEFIIILTETTTKQALITAERIRLQMKDIHYESINKESAVTLSIGIVQSQPEDTSPTILLGRADNALYAAKNAGRDQAYCIQP